MWYPDRSKATEKDSPLYIHISARMKAMLDSAVAKINELIALYMGSLVDKGDQTKEQVCRIISFNSLELIDETSIHSLNGQKKNYLSDWNQ